MISTYQPDRRSTADSTHRTSTPLRIAYVVHGFPMGGLERCVARLANRLNRSRFRPLIVCLARNGDAAQWLEREDVPIVELRKPPGNSWKVVKSLASALKEHDVDVAHSHNWGTLVETTLARRKAGTPYHVHAERGMELSDLRVSRLKWWIRGRAIKWALNRTSAVVTNAEAIRQNLARRFGTLRRPIVVIPNGVGAPGMDDPSAARDKTRASLGISNHSFVIGSVGRLAPVKDFGTAVEALALLCRRSVDAHLLLVGDGPEKEGLLEKVDAAKLQDRVHLVGQRKDIDGWLMAMDAYINVSLNEGMSQSILEAMAAGLPSIVTDVGDNAALVGGDDFCGLVVPAGDASAVADAAENLIADTEWHRNLQARALARHQRLYSVETMIRRYEQFYGSLTNAQAPARTANA